eukprot:CAMPEP_0172056988 /NCGR_PEP_ID=MMETSP1043-20130122/6097_1 /TAXON_ID=464988 /ORGANISM="Hemiselmis andersenii, Strain CCMP441" /LENGTH=111 /DNA_ID=CAMNT_0012716469 /DNA_START=174 /DNA_END=510 /DNA_ORIENTATION=+
MAPTILSIPWSKLVASCLDKPWHKTHERGEGVGEGDRGDGVLSVGGGVLPLAVDLFLEGLVGALPEEALEVFTFPLAILFGALLLRGRGVRAAILSGRGGGGMEDEEEKEV